MNSRINHSTSQMKAADPELSTRSCCIYGLPGTSDTEIDDAFLAIFSSALGTADPNSPFNKNIKSEIKLVSGKKVKVLIADDVNTSINILTIMRKVVGDFKHSTANNPSFLNVGVGDFLSSFLHTCEIKSEQQGQTYHSRGVLGEPLYG